MAIPLLFAFFWILALDSALRRGRGPWSGRRPSDWLLDLGGLLVQGVAVPLASAAVGRTLTRAFPGWTGTVSVGPTASFLLSFVAVDYLYYWNHRLLHGPLWAWHAAHHTAEQLDPFVAARNTLWTPLLIVYLWSSTAGVYLLEDPRPFLLGASATAALDLWRHGGRELPALSWLLITPRDHAWHHSSERHDRNFGANLKCWDRLHGTLHEPGRDPALLGVPLPLGAARRLLFPFAGRA